MFETEIDFMSNTVFYLLIEITGYIIGFVIGLILFNPVTGIPFRVIAR